MSPNSPNNEKLITKKKKSLKKKKLNFQRDFETKWKRKVKCLGLRTLFVYIIFMFNWFINQ